MTVTKEQIDKPVADSGAQSVRGCSSEPAEQTLSKLVKERDEAMLSMLRQAPAGPSGTGQLPIAPVGSLWTGSPGNAAELKLPPVDLNVTAEQIRRAVKERACVKCNGTKIDRQGRACRYCSWRKEPLAEPPAPAVGTLSERMAKWLDNQWPNVVHGFTREVAALEARLAQAERERDEATAAGGEIYERVYRAFGLRGLLDAGLAERKEVKPTPKCDNSGKPAPGTDK